MRLLASAVRTPLGDRVDAVCDRWLAGETGVVDSGRLLDFAFPCRVGALHPGEPGRSKHGRVLDRLGLFALECALEAAEAGGVPRGPRTGVFAAMGGLRARWDEMMAALRDQRDDFDDGWARGLSLLHPFWMLRHLSNNAHAIVSMELGAGGEGATYSGANASAQAIAAAHRALHAGAIDHALVVAYDSLLDAEVLVCRDTLVRGGATDAVPYGGHDAGSYPGEAAVALVLTRDEGAAVVEAAAGVDARAVLGQLGGAGSDLVDGAAVGKRAVDEGELAALAIDHRGEPLVASQLALGQLGAAATAVQVSLLVEVLRRGALPPTFNAARARSGTRQSATALCHGPPGLWGAARVELAGDDDDG